ncbi:MAG: histidine phosphatase family protein [Bacteroidetes bacterium]|nr:histidine phosphatase family protein [Bacteroidota bacterium]
MKKLYLIRHAKSSWDTLGIDDFTRPLNERGKKDAPHMAKLLKQRNVVPDRFITSPAIRALTTCEVFARTFHFDEHKIEKIDGLYHASAETWLRILRALKDRPADKEEIVLAFGHNPGITEFANALLNVGIDTIPTCGIVSATLKIETWREVVWGGGQFLSFDYPKM